MGKNNMTMDQLCATVALMGWDDFGANYLDEYTFRVPNGQCDVALAVLRGLDVRVTASVTRSNYKVLRVPVKEFGDL